MKEAGVSDIAMEEIEDIRADVLAQVKDKGSKKLESVMAGLDRADTGQSL